MYHDAFLGKLILQGNSLNSALGRDWKRKRKTREGRGEVGGGLGGGGRGKKRGVGGGTGEANPKQSSPHIPRLRRMS